jgi:hypothetical protein
MANYHGHDVSFYVPDGWQDRTITAFSAPLKPKQTVTPNIVLTRDSVSEKEPSSTYADKQLVELAKRLEQIDLLSRRDVIIGGFKAVELLFTWHSSNGTLKQQQVFVSTGKGAVLNFVTTALASDFDEVEPAFQAVLKSIRFEVVRG